MSAAEEEARAAAYRATKRRQVAAKAAAEAALLVSDHTDALAVRDAWEPLRRWHRYGVPLVGDDQ